MRKVITALFTISILTFTGCATYETYSRNSFVKNSLIDPCRGKTIGIYTPDVKLGAIRFTFDLRDVKMEVGGQEVALQGRYLEEVEDNRYGLIGILDGNILRKSSIEKTGIATRTLDLIVEGTAGEKDYKVGFFKGLGLGKNGLLSNRTVQWDTSVYPYGEEYMSEPLPSAFSEVTVLDSRIDEEDAPTDLVMYTQIQFDSEVGEILDATNAKTGAYEDPILEGQYYLFLRVSVWFEIKDREGNYIFSTNDKMEYPVYSCQEKSILLPVTPGNADEFAKYFRELDYSQIVDETLNEFVPSVFPLLNDYYVNYTEMVKIEEE